MGQAWVLSAGLCWSVCWFGLAVQQVCWLLWGGSMGAARVMAGMVARVLVL
jgi:hypothetical protein